MKAHVMLRHHKVYPREETIAGIVAAGDKLMTNANSNDLREDCAVVTWNNYGLAKRFAGQCKEAGGDGRWVCAQE